MRVFKVSNLSHGFVGKSIFNRAELMVTDSDRIGLVGPNGCGKSTFLKMLTGEVIPDEWNFESNGRLQIGYLDQYADIDRNLTVYDYLNEVFAKLYKMNAEVDRIYESIAELDETKQMRAVTRAQRMTEYLYAHEFDRIPKKIDSVLFGLGFTDADREIM